MNKITLSELLQYYDKETEPVDRIQIVTGGHDWDSPDEFNIDSELLEPFADYIVTDMCCEESFRKSPVIRVSIKQT